MLYFVPHLDNSASILDNTAHIDSNNFSCPRLGCKHGEDPGATTNVQHHLVLEEVLVVPDGVAVGEGSHLQQNA